MKASKLHDIGKRTAAALLTLALSVMMVPAAAFGANDTNKKVEADATQQDVSIEVGNVTPSNGDKCIDADAANNHTATVKAGNLTTDSNDAIWADTTTFGVVDLATGNITSLNDSGIQARADGASTIKISTGNISSGQIGAGIYATASNNIIGSTQEAQITISSGDIKAEGNGIYLRADNLADIAVKAGNVTAKENGIELVIENGATSSITANNIDAGKNGIFIYVGEGSSVSALVTGILSGKKAPISFFTAFFNDPSRFKLTVWKIKTNNDTVTGLDESELHAQATGIADDSDAMLSSFEKSIQYIMKLTQPAAGATLSATYDDGTALGTEQGYSYAKESETVRLKVNLKEGYELLAAYDGDGNKVELIKGEDGNYYVSYKVPKGGGIGLSVELRNTLDGSIFTGSLGATPSEISNPAKADVQITAVTTTSIRASTAPKTGDDSAARIFLLVCLLLASTLVFASVKRYRSIKS